MDRARQNQRPEWHLLTEDERWADIYVRFVSSLKINVLVIVLIFTYILCVREILGAYSMSRLELAMSVILSLGYCGVLALWNRASYVGRWGTPETHIYTVGVVLFFANLTAIIYLVHFTGGAESLFVFTFALVALMSTFVVPIRLAWSLVAVCILSYAALLFVDYHGWFGHYDAGILSFSNVTSPELATTAMFFIVAAVIIFSVRIGQELFFTMETQRIELAHAKRNLESQVNERTRDLQETLRELHGAYAVLERDKDNQTRFYANITHELRTPINIILGGIANMKDNVYGPLSPAQQKTVDNLAATAQRLLGTIENLLTLSRMEVGKLEYHPESVTLSREIERCVGDVRALAGGRTIEHLIDPADTERHVETDRIKFQHVLSNLLQNAVKFSSGPVRVTTRFDDERVSIQIADEGPGIADDETKAIFEPFHRGAASSNTVGTGLGLPLARNLARLMGGEVQLIERNAPGAVFELHMPRENSREQKAHEAKGDAA